MTLTDCFGHLSSYVQADVFTEQTCKVDTDASYFGIGELHFPNQAVREANVRAPSRAEKIIPHGQAIFGHPQPIAFFCEESEVFHRRQGMVKIYAFLHANATNSFDGFQRRWCKVGQSIRDRMLDEPKSCAFVQSHSLENGAEFSGLDELSSDDIDTATRFINAEYRDRMALMAQVKLLVTEQIVLYRHANYARSVIAKNY